MENSIYVETMTLNELARRFREAGIMTSGKKLADGTRDSRSLMRKSALSTMRTWPR